MEYYGDREPWEFSVGGAVKPLGLGVVVMAGVSLLAANTDPTPLLGLGAAAAIGLAGGYIGTDLLGRASALLDAHRRRAAEIAAISPASEALRAEAEVMRLKTEFAHALAQLDGDHLAFSRSMLEAASLEADGDHNRITWRIGGRAYPVWYAWEWVRHYDERTGYLPHDGEWTAMDYSGISRDEWRSMASAVVDALVNMGLAAHAVSRHGPRWIDTTSMQERRHALAALQIYNAAEMWRAMEGRR